MSPRKPSSGPTLADVAALAGVSKSAASKALNDRNDVSEETKERVLEACKELGYDHLPKLLGPTRYRMVALVSDDLSANYTIEILKGAATAALDLGVALATSYIPDPERRQPAPLSDTWLRLMARSHCLGVITVTTTITREQQRIAHLLGLPVLTIDPAAPIPAGVACIGSTNWNGGLEATQHLISLGHRRIALITGQRSSLPACERHQGYLSALSMEKIPVDEGLIRFGDFSFDAGLTHGRELLSLPKHRRPTAIVAGCDTTAMGVFEAGRELGLRFPDDVSVVGFDDTDIAQWTSPRLTTIRQPLFRMGGEAVRMIVDASKGRSLLTSTPMRLSTRLVVRDSTAPCPR